MEVSFHCSSKARRSAKKSKHRLLEACETVQKVLRLNPQRGVIIPGREEMLRKMRLEAPGLKAGKSGGYRLIYAEQELDEMKRIVLLETYFKGDCIDLTNDEYKGILKTAKDVFNNPMAYDWSEPEEIEEVDEEG